MCESKSLVRERENAYIITCICIYISSNICDYIYIYIYSHISNI